MRSWLKKLQAEADAVLKISASYTVAKAVDDWTAEALDGLADKTVRSHVDLLRPVTMLIGNVPLRDLTAQEIRRTLSKLAQARSTRTMASTRWCGHPARRGQRSRGTERSVAREAAAGQDRAPSRAITPPARILQLAAEHDTEPEAGG